MSTYELPVRCTNCGHKWKLELTKGQHFNNLGKIGYVEKPECPNCGCNTVEKDHDQ